MSATVCVTDDCEGTVHARGLCRVHYDAARGPRWPAWEKVPEHKKRKPGRARGEDKCEEVRKLIDELGSTVWEAATSLGLAETTVKQYLHWGRHGGRPR